MRRTLTMSGETVVWFDPALPLHRNGRLEEALSSFLCGTAVGVVVGTGLATTRDDIVFFVYLFCDGHLDRARRREECVDERVKTRGLPGAGDRDYSSEKAPPHRAFFCKLCFVCAWAVWLCCAGGLEEMGTTPKRKLREPLVGR